MTRSPCSHLMSMNIFYKVAKLKFIKTNLKLIERSFYLNLNDGVGSSEAFNTKKIFLFIYQSLKKLLFDKGNRVHVMLYVSLESYRD